MQHSELTEEIIVELRAKLEQEQTDLTEALSDQGKVDASGDWSAVPPEPETTEEDYAYDADRIEEFFRRGANLSVLEARLVNVKGALTKMNETQDRFGLDEETNEEIPLARLMANPAAKNILK